MTQTSHDLEQTSHGLKQTSHGLEQTSHGSEQTSHGLEQTSHGSEQTSHGSEQTSHGSEQTSRGLEQTIDGLKQTAAHLDQMADRLKQRLDVCDRPSQARSKRLNIPSLPGPPSYESGGEPPHFKTLAWGDGSYARPSSRRSIWTVERLWVERFRLPIFLPQIFLPIPQRPNGLWT